MFSSIGFGEILVLIVVGLFVLGPERLPEAMAWVGRSIRKAKEFATGAQQQLRQDMGPEFEEFRKPLEELNSLRNMNPKRAVRQHLFDGDSDPLGLNDSSSSPERSRSTTRERNTQARHESLTPGEKPPIDPDAT